MGAVGSEYKVLPFREPRSHVLDGLTVHLWQLAARGKGHVRTLITEYAWGYHFDPGTNIVDVVINHLRKKVEVGKARKLITTVRGVGYVIKA